MSMKYLAASLLAATMLAAPAAAAEGKASPIAADLLAQPGGPGPIAKRCDDYIAGFEKQFTALAKKTGPATVGSTLASYDAIVDLLQSGSGEFALYREVMNTAEERAAASTCEVRIEEADSRLSLSRPVFDRLSAIDASGADTETRNYLAKTLRDYKLGGVALDADKRAKVKALNDEISKLGAEFDRNIAESTGSIKALPSELNGLPADFIAAHPPGPDGLITLTTDYPDYVPVRSYADNDALRERLSRVYNSRAYPQNNEVLKQLFAKRQELAEVMGYPDFASKMLQDRMVDTPEKVKALLDGMVEAALPAAKADYARKQALLDELRPGKQLFRSFDNVWLGEKVKERDYDLDPQELRSYLTYDNTRQGVFDLTERLFGVQVTPWDTPLWHEDAEAYEISENGKVIGRFFLDSHPREGKYKHGNAIPLRAAIVGESIPMAALVMNLPQGGYDTGLMTHDSVKTFFHEFGHLLHMLFGKTNYAGTNMMSVEWDFVEAPSQMLEEWMFDYDTLATFAKNEKGEVIPRELVAKMNKARNFDQGAWFDRQLALSNASLAYHRAPLSDDIDATYREKMEEYDLNGVPDNVHAPAAWGHLNGYAAGYYTYMWSNAVALDLFTRFKAAGLGDVATARAYRELVLAPGGSKPAADLVNDFLGRPVTLDAYRAKMAEAAEAK
ncbi:peptidase M3 [Croceicoccus ponticola]|uniref:Peptidase M3 n=1 Tax=Croceicoccus ponticola TaxID=2217664 RepID=A0A437H0G7_9SPHN|nr:M3 family metallopeptidase [Croceicoccus ponticola]RVQ69125.1 peptidase M3 [Croceicoccus ponticola]